MAYQKKVWKDLPLEETPLDADGLNEQEQRIYDGFDESLPTYNGALPSGDVNKASYWQQLTPGLYQSNTTQTNTKGNWAIVNVMKAQRKNTITGAIKVRIEWYAQDETIHYGRIEDNYEDVVWKKIHVETNKGSSLTGGSGLSYAQIMELPIGWSGIAKFSMLTPTIDYYAIKLMASTTGSTSIWVLMAQNDSQIFKYVCFSPNSIIFDKDLLTGNHIKDYVVEQGVTNGVYWEKWNSGKLYQYGTLTNNYGTTNSYGSLFRSDTTLEKTFPQTFASNPMVRVSPIGPNAFGAYVTNTTTTIFGHRLIHVFNQNAGATDVFFEALGRWK